MQVSADFLQLPLLWNEIGSPPHFHPSVPSFLFLPHTPSFPQGEMWGNDEALPTHLFPFFPTLMATEEEGRRCQGLNHFSGDQLCTRRRGSRPTLTTLSLFFFFSRETIHFFLPPTLPFPSGQKNKRGKGENFGHFAQVAKEKKRKRRKNSFLLFRGEKGKKLSDDLWASKGGEKRRKSG